MLLTLAGDPLGYVQLVYGGTAGGVATAVARRLPDYGRADSQTREAVIRCILLTADGPPANGAWTSGFYH